MKKCWLVVLLSIVLAAMNVGAVSAHPADMYFHFVLVSLSPDGLEITWDLTPGPMLAQYIWYDADLDGNEQISDDEAREWAQYAVQSFLGHLDNVPLDLDLASVEWPSDVVALLVGDESIRISLRTRWLMDENRLYRIALQNNYDRLKSNSWFEVRGRDGIVFEEPEQDEGTLQIRFRQSKSGDLNAWLTEWESGNPSVPWILTSLGLDGSTDADGPGGDYRTGTSATIILEGLVREGETSPDFLLIATAVAVMLGALHALSAGHGKTIVAAYLVGSSSKIQHAVALGLVVTLTHTGSIFVLGLLTLVVSYHLRTLHILLFLRMASGLMIVLLGIGLLIPRLRSWRTHVQRQSRLLPHPGTTVGQSERVKTRLVINQPIEEGGLPHRHDESILGDLPRGPVRDNPLRQIRWRSLLTLGISGGLVPCPDAIAILLVAVTINRIGIGLVLIGAFTFGLSLVLIAIGVLIVQGKRLFQRLRWFNRVAYAMSAASALVVFGLGTALTADAVRVFAALSPQDQSQRGNVLSRSFDLDQAYIIYTDLDGHDRYQIFRVPAIGGLPQQLTQDQERIWDFVVGPRTSQVAYVTGDGIRGTRLWQLKPRTAARTLILECPQAFCSDVIWSPDEKGLIYSRLESGFEVDDLGYPSLWWIDLASGETDSLFQDAAVPVIYPQWSSDGQWLSYRSINPQSIQMYHMPTGTRQVLDTQTSIPLAWSPAGDSLLLNDYITVEQVAVRKLFRYTPEDQVLISLIDDRGYHEYSPAWSPDAEWIAVVRRSWRDNAPVRGQQIWLVRADGSDAQPVTQNPDVNYGQPRWSPDGRYLLYSAGSSIRILDFETAEEREVVASGNRPAWLP